MKKLDRMLLRYNSTLGDIQSGFMKLIPIGAMKKSRANKMSDAQQKPRIVEMPPNERTDSKSDIEPKRHKSRSKKTVKVVNRSQAKAMSSLQALKGASLSRGRRSSSSSRKGNLSPNSENEIHPYMLSVDISKFQKPESDTSSHYSLIVEPRRVRFY